MTWRPPLTLWLRPLIMVLGGIVLVALLLLVQQRIAAVAIGAFSLLMAYWTSPLRSGPHTPMATALHRRDEGAALIIWAPGDPLSARLQAAVRTSREGVVWVNALKDPAARTFVAEHGGRGAIPLVLVGEQVRCRVTVAEAVELLPDPR